MKILIVGLKYFAKILTKKLQKYDTENTYMYFDTYYNLKDRIKFLWHLKNSNIIYSINGATGHSKAMDMALKFNKKIILHWQGTDVQLALKSISNNDFNPLYISKPKHLCVAPWLKDELKTININAEYQPIASFKQLTEKICPLPDKFSILTYIREGKEDFYGINTIISIAKEFSDIPIKIVGLNSYKHQILPPNVKLLGWVLNINNEFRDSVLCLRLAKHDGMPFFMLEALLNYRYVGFNIEYEPTFYISNNQSLFDLINKLRMKFSVGELSENFTGHQFIANNFNEQKILKELIKNIIS